MTTTFPTQVRTPSKRTVLMCRPDHFTVSYWITPWMHPEAPTEISRALQQRGALRQAHLDLGFDVHLVEPVDEGFDVRMPKNVNEGEGDFLLFGDAILADTGFRSPSNSHAEVANVCGRAVVTLELATPTSITSTPRAGRKPSSATPAREATTPLRLASASYSVAAASNAAR